jgi:hypothetical protein
MNGFQLRFATPCSYTVPQSRTVAGIAVSAGEKFTSNGYTWMQLAYGREGSGNVHALVTKFLKSKTHTFLLLSSPRRIKACSCIGLLTRRTTPFGKLLITKQVYKISGIKVTASN